MNGVSVVCLGLIAAAFAAACSSTQPVSPAASPGTSAQADCERGGGVWRAALNFCEYPAPNIPR